jgi:hypothetical protein
MLADRGATPVHCQLQGHARNPPFGERRGRVPYEAAVLGIRRLNEDPWLEKIGPATVLEIEVRHPGTTHAVSLQLVERWLAGATTNPNEASKKVKLKMLLMKG